MEEYKKKLDEFRNQIAKLKLKKKKLREKIIEIQKAIDALEDENVLFIYKNVKKNNHNYVRAQQNQMIFEL